MWSEDEQVLRSSTGERSISDGAAGVIEAFNHVAALCVRGTSAILTSLGRAGVASIHCKYGPGGPLPDLSVTLAATGRNGSD